ncbi:MAG: DNA-processing protein DprA [Elusimicrobiota bacterium]
MTRGTGGMPRGRARPESIDPDREVRRCRELGVRMVGRDSGLYPELLQTIPDAPRVLYVRGRLPLMAPALALVGSRRPSLYGRRMARRFAGDCAAAGIVVVSGLARGIDAEAHQAALGAGGVTWAVLGSGLDRVYPPENASLAERIVEAGGALVSEVPLGGPPVARNFPLRNRILSGLAWGTVVIEGDGRSGSLITARAAAEQGREVFAVPGPADAALSEAPHSLLRKGARIATGLGDVLDELPRLGVRELWRPQEPEGSAPARGLSLNEKRIFELLGSHSLSLEDMVSETGWDVPRLVHVLTEMEGRGFVSPLPGQRYART